jgi:class 3 adenylate cyclase
VSFSVASRTWPTAGPRTASPGHADADAAIDVAAAPFAADGAALRPYTLRFVDEDLERRYQVSAGADNRTGFRMTTGAAAVLWFVAAGIVPAGTPIPLALAVPLCLAMALLNEAALLASDWAGTLDRQHGIVATLTSINGLVILWLASTGRVLPGYGISAVMLLFAFGFLSRTGFIYAAARTAVIVVGYAVVALASPVPGRLLVDAFILIAAVIGMLVALRLLERSRRRVFSQGVVILQQADALRLEKERADALLLNVLPARISRRLLDGERTIADEYPAVTVLFADIVGFTPLAARLDPEHVIGLLGALFSRFDDLVAERGLEKIKTIGDAYMVAGGLPDPVEDHAERVVDLALAMIAAAGEVADGVAELRLRIGVHSGPVVGGVIGQHKIVFDIWGDTVNVASRLESQGVAGRISVSDATWQLVRERFDGVPCGSIDLKGHGPVETFAVVGRRPERILAEGAVA